MAELSNIGFSQTNLRTMMNLDRGNNQMLKYERTIDYESHSLCWKLRDECTETWDRWRELQGQLEHLRRMLYGFVIASVFPGTVAVAVVHPRLLLLMPATPMPPPADGVIPQPMAADRARPTRDRRGEDQEESHDDCENSLRSHHPWIELALESIFLCALYSLG